MFCRMVNGINLSFKFFKNGNCKLICSYKMDSKRNYLKKLIEDVENLKIEDARVDAELTAKSLQCEFMEKNLEWLRIFVDLGEKKEARESKLLESHLEDQFLFGDLVEKIFDNSSINNLPQHNLENEMKPLLKKMDDIIEDTESVYEFYNNLSIVKTYRELTAEYNKSQETLKNLEQQNPISEEDIKNFNLLVKERDRIIVKLVMNSQKIANTKTEMEKNEDDFNESMKVKNEEIKQLNTKLQILQKKKVEYDNMNKVKSKFTMSHIDIFKIPDFPAKVSKNILTQNKFKANENKNIKKPNKHIKSFSTFPILPLHRNCTSKKNENILQLVKLDKPKKVEVIEDKLIKSAELKCKDTDFGKNIETFSTEIKLNKAISNININDNNKIDDIRIPPNCITNTVVQQKLNNSSDTTKLTEDHKDVPEQANKIGNVTITSFVDDAAKTFTNNLPKIAKRKSIDKKEITTDDKSKPGVSSQYLKNQNVESKLDVVNPEKRFRSGIDSLKMKELITNDNQATNLNLKEKSENVKCLKQKSLKEKSLQIKEGTQSKDEIFNFNFDGFSLDDSDKPVKAPEEYDFNFDGGNMNFDEMGNESNFFDSGGDLDFASDNQFGADCNSFKF